MTLSASNPSYEGIRYDDDGIYFVNACGCEARLEPVGIFMLWRSHKVCEEHLAKRAGQP